MLKPIPLILAFLASCSEPCTDAGRCEKRGGTWLTYDCHNVDVVMYYPDGDGNLWPSYSTDRVCSHRCEETSQ